MDKGYICLILTGLLSGALSAAVSEEETPTREIINPVKYERLFNRFWQQSTVARRNTPPFDEHGMVEMKYGMSLIDVREVNDETGVVELLVWEQMMWKDGRMVWSPAESGGILNLRVPPSMLWILDLMTYNSIRTDDIETRSDVNTVVSSDGTVKYIPPSYKKIRCDMNEDKSVASCKLKVGSWTFNGFQVDLQFYGEERLDLSSFTPSKLVPRVENNIAQKHVKYYDCCPEPYEDITFNFDLVLGGGDEEDGEDAEADA